MKHLRKTLTNFVIAVSIVFIAPNFTNPAPDLSTFHTYTQTIVHVQAKTKYVLITRTGKKYHLRKCGRGTYYKTTLKNAKAMGLTPCKKCFGY